MNNMTLLIPALEIWGSVFIMSCSAYLIIHKKTLAEATGRFLILLESNMSLLLICSLAINLIDVRRDSVPKAAALFFRLLLALFRINQIVLSAACLSLHLPRDRFTSRLVRLSAAFACLSLFLQIVLLGMRLLEIPLQAAFYGGRLYFFLPAAGTLLFLSACIAGLLLNRRKIPPGYFRALLSFFLVPLITLMAFGNLNFVDLAFGFSSLTLYGIIFVEQRRILLMREEWLLAERERLARQKEEMTQIEIQLVLSQIQPSFLKDTLMTISGLCDTDTEAARAGVSVFADYLRGNMRSLDRYEPVFFEGHLPHIRNFLYLENLKYGEKLKSRFDFETVDFAIPLLCIQPLLENAVRYGIAPLGMGTVTLRTRRKKDCILVEVEDDGAGFDYDPDKDLKGAYPGIHAVRSRIVRQSGGSLEIISSPGRGTLARIMIPA